MRPGRHIVLLGPMAAGKSTIGDAVAAALGRPLVDSDAAVRSRTGLDARQLANRDGVAALHAIEHAVMREALDDPEPSVIAAAASVVDDAGLLDALQDQLCVRLWADRDVLAARHPAGVHRRSVAQDEADRLALREERRALVASLTIDTGSLSVAAAAARIVACV